MLCRPGGITVLSTYPLTKPRFKRRPRRDEARARANPVREAAWAFEERVVWAGADAARAGADAARWPFERLYYTFEDKVLWPLQDAYRGSSRQARRTAVAAVAAAALGAGAAGALSGAPATGPSDPAPVAALSAPAPTAAPTPAPVEATGPAAPVLQGAVPEFEPAAGTPASRAAAEAPASPAQSGARGAAAEAPIEVPTLTPDQRRRPLPVARAFSEAFVLYEIGLNGPEVREIFRLSAVPPLAKALNERPPRQPAGTEVPQAEVLNVVAGPASKDRVSVSTSLLRLGTTTELRLDLERSKQGIWRVMDVRG